MSIFTEEDIRRLQHRIYLTFLYNPRLYYDEGAKKCGTVRNTFTKYWKEGLDELIYFPPQIRLKMYRTRKEYIYLVESETPNKLYKEFKLNPDVIYLSYTLGHFDLLIQTCKPLQEIPEKTLFCGSRSNYDYPETPYCTFESALKNMRTLLNQEHKPSKSTVTYPDEPFLKGAEYGWRILPYVKYDLKTNYTYIVKKTGLSFSTFYKGFEYLLNVSTVLLPYYPYGFKEYYQHFFIFWTDYENLIRDLFAFLPSHVSITKVEDALILYINIQEGAKFREEFLDLCYLMLELGYLRRFWTAQPVYHWHPDPP